MNEFTITTKFESRELLQLQMKLLYSKAWIRVLTVLAIVYILSFLVALLFNWDHMLKSDSYSFGIFIVTMAVYIPILAYFMNKRNNKRNMRLRELVSYHFSEHNVTSKGESFSATYTWENLYKLQLFKGWLLLYHGPMGANVIKLGNDDFIHVQELMKYLQAQNHKVKIKI